VGYATLTNTPSKILSDYIALKHIYNTTSPKRIANEIKILQQVSSSKWIASLIKAFRKEGQIFAVMPYIQHDFFIVAYTKMNLIDTKHYMRSFLAALKHLHHHKILHRDIKPDNFLHSLRKNTGCLINFGLTEVHLKNIGFAIY
jgi:cell division control protein 7